MSDMTTVMFALSALMLPMLMALTAGCGVQQPTITTTASENDDGWHPRAYRAPYGEDFILDCSSHDTVNSNLTIQSDGICVQTKRINATTIRAILKPNLGNNLYSCVDSGCEDSLAVDVEPAMSVTASGVRYITGTDGYRVYFVSRGEPYGVSCSSDDPASLHLKRYWELSTDIVNDTTVTYHTQADRTEDRIYQCFDDDRNYQMVTVTVDFSPVAKEFECVLYHWRQLECSWQSYSERNTFRLSYEREDLSIMLCADDSGDRNVTCKWFNRYKGKELLNADENCTLTLQTCNEIYCNDQTFDISCNSITKIDAVSDFKLLNTSSRGAFLAWSIPTAPRQFLGANNYTYKIEYRLKVFGEKWRSANTSTVACDFNTCEYLLTLPYPESEYEARVYMKFLEAAENKLWSEPASIDTIFTEPREECACNTLPTPPSSTTPFEASCLVCKLTEITIKSSMMLTKHKSNLKRKLDKIKRYTRILNDLDSLRTTLV